MRRRQGGPGAAAYRGCGEGCQGGANTAGWPVLPWLAPTIDRRELGSDDMRQERGAHVSARGGGGGKSSAFRVNGRRKQCFVSGVAVINSILTIHRVLC
jgi:hypothetical protein